ncbi:MAG: DUF1934 domain-containing protein [Cellulosilyticum sp.]|nr:DUF1934 domain-containing protein [Cellulosilyticum sp.]
MKDVQIRIYDKQIYSSHFDESQNEFKGKIAVKDNDIYILYKDQTTQTNTTIKASEQGVSIKRTGAMNGNLQFEKGKTTRCLYGTPYGNMLIDIETANIEVYLLEKGVKIYIEYAMLMDGEKMSDNIFIAMAN